MQATTDSLHMYIYTGTHPLVGVKRKRCGECESCSRDDCGQCKYCLDMKKFGGPAKMKKSCMLKKCKLMKFTTIAPKTKASEDENVPTADTKSKFVRSTWFICTCLYFTGFLSSRTNSWIERV